MLELILIEEDSNHAVYNFVVSGEIWGKVVIDKIAKDYTTERDFAFFSSMAVYIQRMLEIDKYPPRVVKCIG